MSRKGSGVCCARPGTSPVRVMVCHWSRMRPVLSINPRVLSGVSTGRLNGVTTNRPLHGFERIIRLLVERREATDIEGALAVILECRQCGVLAKNLRGTAISERLRKAHA